MVEDVELNRLYWHSRRGMLELDVLLVPFVKEVYPHLNEVDRALLRPAARMRRSGHVRLVHGTRRIGRSGACSAWFA